MKRTKLIGIINAAVLMVSTASFAVMSAFADGEEAAAEATSAADGAVANAGASSFFTLVLPLIIMFALLYFVAIRPQKKRDRELKEMQDSLQVGDEIVTGGGIVGIVVSTGEDTVVIETGGAKHKLRIKNWAITENVTAAERIKESKAAGAAKKSEKSGLAAAAVVDDEDDKKSKKSKKDEE